MSDLWSGKDIHYGAAEKERIRRQTNVTLVVFGLAVGAIVICLLIGVYQ